MFKKARHVYDVLVAHKYTTIAGTLTFFLILAAVPFLFWLTLLFGSTGITGEEIFELHIFGWAKDLLLFLRENAAEATSGAGIFFLVTTLWSCTGFFYHLRRSGEIVYGYRRRKKGWRVRVSAALITFAVLVYFFVSGGILLAAVISTRFLSPWIGYPAVYAILLVLGFFAAWILNAYLCPYKVSPADTVTGSALTAALWLVASAAFVVYLNFSSGEKLYGALSLVIVFLLWLYWMMICFSVGVIYNCRKLEHYGLQSKTL